MRGRVPTKITMVVKGGEMTGAGLLDQTEIVTGKGLLRDRGQGLPSNARGYQGRHGNAQDHHYNAQGHH